MQRRRATMSDVAKRAAVSTATVSYYLSGRPDLMRRIGADTQDRIRSAVDELGYLHNQAARQLRLNRTQRVCVMLSDVGVPFAARIAQDVERAAQARGHTAIVAVAGTPDACRSVVAQVAAGLADALVAEVEHMPPDSLPALFGPLRDCGKPVLAMHPRAEAKGFSVIRHGRLAAFAQALDHLYATGRRRIAYIRHLAGDGSGRSDYLRAFCARHPDMAPPTIVTGSETRTDAVRVAMGLLEAEPKPDAFLIQSDFGAVAVINALRARGIDVPGAVAVIGSGNVDEGRFSTPRLTTIGPLETSIAAAAGHLLDGIGQAAPDAGTLFEVEWALVRRESA